MSYFNDLKSFYRVLSPSDLFGKVSVRQAAGSPSTAAADFSYDIYRTYIEKATAGPDIIAMAKGINVKNAPDPGLGRGYLFNTLHQKSGGGGQDVLDPDYWQWVDPIDDKSQPTPTLRKINDFYKEVCGVDSPLPVDLTINVLRTPRMHPSSRNVGEVELFLNSMPTIFASQLIPYFEVEFQMPQVPDLDSKARYLNRPSLLRFLLGSEVDPSALANSAADRALIASIKNPDKKSPNKNNYYVGPELYTAPQTLTNMDALSPRDSVARLGPVMPFYPLASLMGGSVKQIGAGAGTFSRTLADFELKVHDRARVSEFSEFLRGPAGYGDTTVWLTYGWLAPRGRGDDDHYAKFINNNMLVKRAFQVKNAGFSFDTAGQCTIKVECVSKNMVTLENESINSVAPDSKLATLFKDLRIIAAKAKRARKLLGASAGEGMTKEIRIFQILDSAAAGEMFIDIPPEEIAQSCQGMIAAIKANKSLSEEDRKFSVTAIENVASLYDSRNAGRLRGAQARNTKENLKACIKARSADPFIPPKEDLKKKKLGSGDQSFYTEDFVKATYEFGLPSPGGPKPPPDARGRPVPTFKGGKGRQYVWRWEKTRTPLTEEELEELELTDEKARKMNTKKAKSKFRGRFYLKRHRNKKGLRFAQASNKAPPNLDPQRNVVSFGKLFSSFCLPAILKSASEDKIDEVQINFYQLNESCGPASLHSIAEFPVDINQFVAQFTDYCVRRGGEAVTLLEFMEFVSQNVFSDDRSPGYGMRNFFYAFEKEKPEPVPPDEAGYQSKMAKWYATYKEFKKPNIVINSEVLYESEGAKSDVDLLTQLSSVVGPTYKGPQKGKKMIKRIHIIDATLDPSSMLRKDIMRTPEGYYVKFDNSQRTAVEEQLSRGLPTAQVNSDSINIPDVKIVGSGPGVLKDFLGFSIPTIIYGAQGTTITNMSLASKMDGTLATIALLGGSFKAKSGLAPNGLGMQENNLPVRFIPAQLTMNSLGCPLAELYQSYFFDFGTGTTLDNVYSCNQITHTFSPGKFDTNWNFLYNDGYGKFYGASGPSLKELAKEITEEPKSFLKDPVLPGNAPAAGK